MSVQQLTTFNRAPSDTHQIILGFLDGDDLSEFAATSDKSRQRVYECYVQGCKDNSQVMDAYKASQGSQEAIEIQRRANSLIGKTKRLMGGEALIQKIGNVLCANGQSQLADARFACKAIGLLPFFQAMPEAQDLLVQVKSLKTSREKFKAMKKWLEEHPEAAERVAQIENIRLMSVNVRDTVASSFFAIPGKVYNFVPKEIAYFNGLRRLNLSNNLLKELPEEIAYLPVEELDISLNFFETMPPVIPSLRVLKLTGPYNEIPPKAIVEWVQNWVEKGGKNLAIHLDENYLGKFDSIDIGSDYAVRISKEMGNVVLRVEEILEQTQILSDTEN
ncbi:MAG: leucine-rich repeat domain-containing protein [Parachlamydiales bacterium]|nr:leucine-rich repeat domain-containing protein [Parachlamydiales bacterium]